MRLKSLWISEYKNLKDFSLTFANDNFIDIFVGKNGSGKSNLFEALIEIFRHIYEFDKSGQNINFDYSITYEIDNKSTTIVYKGNQLIINDKERKNVRQTLVPDNILIYYSGHNTIISSLISRYKEVFNKRIQLAGVGESRRFISIGPEYKELLLAVILMQPTTNKARGYVLKKLGIRNVGTEVKVILNRPGYAAGKTDYNVDTFIPETSYWKAQGITKNFLDKLSASISTYSKGPHRDEGYLPSSDKYINYYDINKVNNIFIDNNSLDLFQQFDNLNTIGMLSEISIPIILENNLEATITHFSDGQFQSVYIYAVTELFKDKNCITLLDEPDSFLHPEWQFDFLNQISDITNVATKTNHTLMSSHSAVTLINHESDNVNMLTIRENKVLQINVNKNYAIKELSSSQIKYSKDEDILNILHRVSIEEKPIFFTEGSTDPVILETAWNKLYDEPIPFIPILAFNCEYLRRILQDERILNELNGLSVFGMFDFDEAYNDWNALATKQSWAPIVEDPYSGLLVGDTSKNRYAFLLPVPKIPEIETLVINSKEGTHYGYKSKMAIEHLFYADDKAETFFGKETVLGGAEIVIFNGDKTKFAEDIIPEIDDSHFEVFRPMFDFVKSKC